MVLNGALTHSEIDKKLETDEETTVRRSKSSLGCKQKWGRKWQVEGGSQVL